MLNMIIDYSEVVTQKVKDVNLNTKTSKEIREIGCISFAKKPIEFTEKS